jgi:membrane fusion protein (multidrug efflux system)
VGAEDKVESRQIAASYRLGNEWVVDSGLKAGDRIVVEGVGKLKPGAAVKPVMVAAAGSASVADPRAPAAKK